MKHFNMTQWRVLCPHNHLLKTTTITGNIRELSSPRDVQSASWQSASWRICELSSYPPCQCQELHTSTRYSVPGAPWHAECQCQVHHTSTRCSMPCSMPVPGALKMLLCLTTMTASSQPQYRTICVSWDLLLWTGGFCCSKVSKV